MSTEPYSLALAARRRRNARVRASRGEWVWGLDPAVGQQAFGFAPIDAGAIVVETLDTRCDATEGERLGLLDRRLRAYAEERAVEFPPAAVWVEQPSGRFRNLQLAYAVGVLQGALFETLRVPVWTIPSSTWKRATVGAGNASKEQVAAWVQAQGADFNAQDEAHAYAIAAAGRAMLCAGECGIPPLRSLLQQSAKHANAEPVESGAA